jgi:predicted dinucleotide-binding enzyme
MTHISILGAGNIGGRLAKGWHKAGHTVRVGVRNPESPKAQALRDELGEAVPITDEATALAGAEVVVLALPGKAVTDLEAELGPIPHTAVVIDTMNAFTDGKAAPTGPHLAQLLGHDHIVKAFNSIGAENIDNPHYDSGPADMFLAGNYPDDKMLVSGLIAELGFEPVDVGGLDMEVHLVNMATFWVNLARGPLGRRLAFKLLR